MRNLKGFSPTSLERNFAHFAKTYFSIYYMTNSLNLFVT